MRKLRVIIVDDEPLARERLRRLLASEPEVEIVAECGDGASAVDAVREQLPDLLLLDIQMPGMNGFEVLRALRSERMPAVIFVTAHDKHAVQAFEARALDYLLKPTSRRRLSDALARVRERIGAAGEVSVPQSLLDLIAERYDAASRVRRYPVRTGERTTFVSIDEIDWVEAAGNYVILHAGKQNHILRETMNALEGELPATRFLRVSRSAIVNLQRVKELQSVTPGEHLAILAEGTRIPITRSLRDVEERLRFV